MEGWCSGVKESWPLNSTLDLLLMTVGTFMHFLIIPRFCFSLLRWLQLYLTALPRNLDEVQRFYLVNQQQNVLTKWCCSFFHALLVLFYIFCALKSGETHTLTHTYICTHTCKHMSKSLVPTPAFWKYLAESLSNPGEPDAPRHCWTRLFYPMPNSYCCSHPLGPNAQSQPIVCTLVCHLVDD